MRANPKLRAFAHQGGIYSGRQVKLPQRECGHLMTAPACTSVTRMSLLHLGHDMSYSVTGRICNFGPFTIRGGVDIQCVILLANVVCSNKSISYQLKQQKRGQFGRGLQDIRHERGKQDHCCGTSKALGGANGGERGMRVADKTLY